MTRTRAAGFHRIVLALAVLLGAGGAWAVSPDFDAVGREAFRARASGLVAFRTHGKQGKFRATAGTDAVVTLRVGGRCAQSHMMLRPRGAALVFP